MSSSEGAGGPLISQDLFQSFRGEIVGVDEGREAIRGMKTLKPQTLAGALHAKTTQSRVPWTFAVSKVWKYMYEIHALKQIPVL